MNQVPSSTYLHPSKQQAQIVPLGAVVASSKEKGKNTGVCSRWGNWATCWAPFCYSQWLHLPLYSLHSLG